MPYSSGFGPGMYPKPPGTTASFTGEGGGGFGAPKGPMAAPAPMWSPPPAPTFSAPTGGGGGGSTSTAAWPKPKAYQPYGGPGAGLKGGLETMAGYGKGLMDPTSDYYKKLQEQMMAQIGGQAQAGQRASALRAAYGGFGAGAGAEQMATSADIGQAGLEAQGMAGAGLALQAPQLGMQALGSTFAPYMGLEQLGESSKQFGAGLGEQARQFGIGAGLQQQGMAQTGAMNQAQLDMQKYMAEMQAAQQYNSMMANMAMSFGGMY